MTNSMDISFGIPDEWAHFGSQHQMFLQKFPNLGKALRLAFMREVKSEGPVDHVVFFVGRLCVEEFMEVLLLCGNGYGIAGQKIIRGMFERVITARYLHLHPEQTDDFLDFHWVAQRKLANAIQESLGEEVLGKEKMQDIEEKFHAVKDRFMVTECAKCGTKRLNYTWSKLDLVSMARLVGSIGDLVVPAYYLPTREAHSTVGAIFSRLKETENGILTFDEGPQHEQADNALISAHNLLLNVLDLQREHFNLDSLEEPLQVCFQDFLEIWKQPKHAPTR